MSEQEFLLELTVILNETCSLYPNVLGHAIVLALNVVSKMHPFLGPGQRYLDFRLVANILSNSDPNLLVKPGKVKSGQVKSEHVKSGQVRSLDERSI